MIVLPSQWTSQRVNHLKTAKVKEGKEKVKEKFFKKKELQSQPLAGEPAPTLQSSTRGNARGIVWNGVVGLLGIAEQSLDGVPVPGLKSAISVLLQVVNWLQQGTDSTYAIRQLENSVKFFNQSVSEPLKKYKEKGIPPELSQAIEILSANFDKAISPLKLYRGQNVVQQWADRDKIGGDIVAAGEGVRDAVSAFQAAQVVRISLGIEQLLSDKEAEQLESHLNKLPYALDASYDTDRPGAPSGCFAGTRTEIIENIRKWLHRPTNDTSKSVYWVNGLAGIGKSTIARTIAQYAKESGLLGSSFFFVRQHTKLSSAEVFLGTIVRDLAKNLPSFGTAIVDALKKNEKLAHASLATRFSELFFGPLRLHGLSAPLLLVIDALDECDPGEANGAKGILRYLIDGCTAIPGFRILITSRPEHHITIRLNQAVNVDKVVIHEVDKDIVSRDIELYLRHRFESIRKEFSDRLQDDWPPSRIVDNLAKKAGGLFIWAATAANFIGDGQVMLPERRLDAILGGADPDDASPYADLDSLYKTVLSASVDRIPRDVPAQLYRLLHVIVLLKDPLPMKALSTFATVSDAKSLLTRIQSIIPLPSEPEGKVEVYHPSFPDFIIERCEDPQLRVDVERHERWMALRCLNLLNENLIPAIDGIVPWNSLNAGVENLNAKLAMKVGDEVQYACRFWTSHLGKLRVVDDEVRDVLERFTGLGSTDGEGLLLRWISVMSMMGYVGDAARGIREILPWMRTKRLLDHIATILHEAFRMILTYARTIEASAAHISQSILPFLPTNSHLLGAFQQCPNPTVTLHTKLDSEWPPSIATLISHSQSVESVAFSPDGLLLASASGDHTIRLWDPHTGSHLKTLEGHSGWVTSVAFSPDGLLLASASDDHAIRLWDPQTGSHLKTLEGHSGWVKSVAFSPDGLSLASASGDDTIKLWDTHTGSHLRTLEGHSHSVTSVAFSPISPNGLLASASGDHTIKLWDPQTGCHLKTLHGHPHWVTSVAFSPDGSLLASGSLDDTIWLWDPCTGSHLRTLEGHSHSVMSVAFSQDGLLLVSASGDHTVKLWDAHTGSHTKTFVGHSQSVTSVAFSPDKLLLASASLDDTIRLWDPHTGSHTKAPFGHHSWVRSVAFSPDGSLLASAGHDDTVRLWDPCNGSHLKTLEGHSHSVTSVAFSPNGLLLASASHDDTIRLWDPYTGSHLKTLQGHSDWVTSVVFSPNGSLLASASDDHTIKLWDPYTGSLLKTLEGHSHSATSVAFSPDGSLLASALHDDSIRLWDPNTGGHLKTLETHPQLEACGSFSIQNTRQGQWICVDAAFIFALPLHLSLTTKDSHGFLVAFGTKFGQVLILDISPALKKLTI